jgi:hypothetical protein
VILEFSDFDTVSGGWAGQAVPKHVVELRKKRTMPGNKDYYYHLHSMEDAERYYQLCAQPLERLWLTLHGGLGGATSTASASSSTAFQQQKQQQQELAQPRVVIIHPDFILNRFWKLAVCRILQDICGVTRIAFQPVLSVIPQALQYCWTSSSNSSTTTTSTAAMMIIHVSAAQVQCMVHANGYALDYTYQSIGTVLSTEQVPPSTVEDLYDAQRNMVLPDHSSLSLLIALCRSLEATPMELRKEVISNLIFTGHVVLPRFGQLVSKRLYEFLAQEAQEEGTGDEEKKSSGSMELATSPVVTYTHIPVHRKLLHPLAKHVGMLDLKNVAPQQLSFLGASVWAEHSKHIEWTIV